MRNSGPVSAEALHDSISIQEGDHSIPHVMEQGLSVTYHIGQVSQGQPGPVMCPSKSLVPGAVGYLSLAF